MSSVRVLAVAVAVVIAVGARTARADGREYHEEVPARVMPRWFSMPLEWGHAAAWVADRDGPVYRAMVGVLPGVQFGPLALHAAFQGHYRNPDFDAGLGGQMKLLVMRQIGGIVVGRLFAESVYRPIGQGVDVLGGVQLGAGNLAHLSLLGGYDTDREAGFFGVRIGVELTSFADPVGAITYYAPNEELPSPGKDEPPPVGDGGHASSAK